MQPQDIKILLETGLEQATVTVEGDGRHFYATVISPIFAAKTRIQKQQIVYAALGNRIADGTIHAISLKTFTPEEWQSQSGANNG
jgi:acid stress-induced BolA-like protein IbaG/YrbA